MGALGLVADSDVLRVCEGLINQIAKEVSVEVTPGSFELLDTVLQHLGGYEVHGKDEAEQQVFIDLVLAVQDICIYLGKEVPLAQELCHVAIDLAIERGDLRLKAILALAEGMLHTMVGGGFSKSGTLLSDCIETIQMLGDRDIQLRSSIFLVPLYFLLGDLKKALHYHNMAAFYPALWNSQFLSELFPVYSCGAAHLMADYPLALGIADSGYRKAVIQGQGLAEVWWGLQLSAVLIDAGGNDAIVEGHLRRAETILAPKQYVPAYLALLQIKACYLVTKNEIAKAHGLMCTFFEMALEYGIRKPMYGRGMMLELCVGFRRRGCPPFEGFELDQELVRALEGEDRVQVGIALRSQALFAFDSGASLATVEALLRQSVEVFRGAGCVLHQVSTETMLKNLRAAGMGDMEVLSPDNVAAIKAGARMKGGVPENLARQCASALKGMSPWGDIVDYFQEAVFVIQREFRAERVALMRLSEGGQVECVAACNVSEAEVQHGAFNLVLSGLQESLRLGEATPIHAESFLAVSIPLQLQDGRSWILYAESKYTVDQFSETISAINEELELIISAEFRSALLLHEAREVKRIQPQWQSSSAPAYYGELMQAILQQAHQAAMTDATILILGETGVGKELFARSIHEASGRTGAFIPVHPASMAESLFESELFGHEKGAFTGAVKQKTGLLEMAHEGTLFIDEVGEIPLSLQVKLLRVLQDRIFARVGGTRQIHSKFRLVAATNRDLKQEVKEGRFREDLFYRLFVVPFTLPPLRGRGSDISYLVRIFLDHFSRRYSKELPVLTPQQMEMLERYAWPGNIRELKGVVERAAILSDGSTLEFMLHHEEGGPGKEEPTGGEEPTLYSDLPTLKELQRRYLKHVMTLSEGNVSRAEGILGVKRSTLYAQLKRFGLAKRGWR